MRPALAAAALAIAGCAVDDERAITARPEPIVIDTFENGSLIPDDPRFNRWGSVVYNTDLATREYRVTGPGFDSAFSLMLTWEFSDPPDGIFNYPDALIRTQALGAIDVTAHESLTFAYRYEAAGACRPLTVLRVSLGCSELVTAFQTLVPIDSTWRVASLPFTDFAEPDWGITGASWQDCLSRVDEYQFISSYGLADGECAAGTLWLDDIAIR
jgi:hypothetical protein